MLSNLEYTNPGYAGTILALITRATSEKTLIHPSDLMVLKLQMYNLPGLSIEGNIATVELDIGHPQGFGNYFETELIETSGIKKGNPEFRNKYPDEEFLGYDLTDESGYLLTEEGEMIVL
jgi:hypothetical protein